MANALFPILPLYVGGDTTDRHVVLLSKLSKVRRDHTTQLLAQLQMDFPVSRSGALAALRTLFPALWVSPNSLINHPLDVSREEAHHASNASPIRPAVSGAGIASP